MADLIVPDQIDFAKYMAETDVHYKVRSAGVWVQELINRIGTPLASASHHVLPWSKTHGLVQFRPGELTVWGGANGNGKSMVTGQVALSLCAQGAKVCIASFEMKPLKTLERMGRQWVGFNPGDQTFLEDQLCRARAVDAYEQFRDWTDGRLWLYDQQGSVQAEQINAMTRYCAKEKRIEHVFIDSLMKCVAGEDDYNGQKLFVDNLTAIARDHHIHVHLIHHIKKPQDDAQKPGKYDFKGSGAITDLADNVISVWRNKPKERKLEEGNASVAAEPDAFLICDKQRNGEWEGRIGLWFDRDSQQFLGGADDPLLELYLDPRT